jgi:hypothetical protein
MADLLKEYFKRDLTDAEDQKLAKQLAASPRAALRFARLAQVAYVQTGLPKPSAHGAHAGHAAHAAHTVSGTATHFIAPVAVKIASALLVTAATTLVVLNHRAPAPQEKPAPTPIPVVQPSVTLKPSPIPTPVPFHPSPTPSPTPARGMVQPLAFDPLQKYSGLDMMVQKVSPGLVTVRILDGSGNEIRLLFAGMLEQGKWEFQWDGKRTDGSLVEPGLYQAQVESDGQTLTKEIKIDGENNGSPK